MLKLRPPAKINLVLEVLRKRADGYHDIRTVMQSIDLCDEIAIEEHTIPGHLELHTDTMSCPVDEKNLVWQAIHWLRQSTGFDGGLAITINKNIPIGGGLGGGSSDAGAVLLALVSQYGLDVGRDDLNRIAARIGSDVSYFLVGGTALATGRGEIVQPMPDLPETAFVLANPGIAVDTARVYASLGMKETKVELASKKNACAAFLDHPHGLKRWELMKNDLQSVARRLYPRLNEVFAILSALGAEHLMLSGSGATVFAPVESQDEAKELVVRLQTAGFWASACQSINRRQFGLCRVGRAF
ncbi:MAG: 4-(cytidine 5'-diphospho)-2-C-methyl-D-erythritol kinase [Candidatus Coatesbacteria bacterium]|nr:4-(cytidine 5'-diphospho)-2-C-methyl-D-erythritol kinase [Candidatus Coatesbacteria bacterium]